MADAYVAWRQCSLSSISSAITWDYCEPQETNLPERNRVLVIALLVMTQVPRG